MLTILSSHQPPMNYDDHEYYCLLPRAVLSKLFTYSPRLNTDWRTWWEICGAYFEYSFVCTPTPSLSPLNTVRSNHSATTHLSRLWTIAESGSSGNSNSTKVSDDEWASPTHGHGHHNMRYPPFCLSLKLNPRELRTCSFATTFIQSIIIIVIIMLAISTLCDPITLLPPLIWADKPTNWLSANEQSWSFRHFR